MRNISVLVWQKFRSWNPLCERYPLYLGSTLTCHEEARPLSLTVSKPLSLRYDEWSPGISKNWGRAIRSGKFKWRTSLKTILWFCPLRDRILLLISPGGWDKSVVPGRREDRRGLSRARRPVKEQVGQVRSRQRLFEDGHDLVLESRVNYIVQYKSLSTRDLGLEKISGISYLRCKQHFKRPRRRSDGVRMPIYTTL